MGKLYLIPSPLGENSFSHIFPVFNSQIINEIDVYIVEELRTARRFLKRLGIQKPIDSLTFHLLNEHIQGVDLNLYLESCLQGKNTGLISEAGVPCVADPGSIVVAKAHQLDIEVVPLVGPNSILLALMASGFNGQNFAFNGYLPIEQDKREARIRSLEACMLKTGQTQIFIETPYRNNHLLDSLLRVCDSATRLCIAANVATESQKIKAQSISKWRKTCPDLHKQPAIFLLGK
ncbi:MAG: SAM-dependent methyltransferase [Bacteroidales bacterium]|jgi:16S rRNA (cytidine1402-2'-O)-methyltransferase|nr:SAM-dependent methyltransferase [Bacteroidales bacterium]